MRVEITFLIVYLNATLASLSDLRNLTHQWDTSKRLQRRRYRNQKQEILMRDIFQKKIKIIEERSSKHKRGLESYTFKLNQFADLMKEEHLRYTQGLKRPLDAAKLPIFANLPTPEAFDWRSIGAVTEIKNQGTCGSCWAFSTVGALEAHYKIRYGSSVLLSEQQILDCEPQGSGCGGGWMTDAYTYIAENGGINYENYYPYREDDGYCRYRSSKPKVEIKGYVSLEGPDEETLKEIVFTRGPVSVAIDATGYFANYGGGVYYNPHCSTKVFTHAVVVMGYGRENGLDYWLVKNSWGKDWGLNGYIKMARNQKNHCGIASKVSYPVF